MNRSDLPCSDGKTDQSITAGALDWLTVTVEPALPMVPKPAVMVPPLGFACAERRKTARIGFQSKESALGLAFVIKLHRQKNQKTSLLIVSKKSPKIAALIAHCQGHARFDAHYLGYFHCFNQQLYYEAHDVLEELWLGDKFGPNGNFYKGLIQFTGAFVHLQKQRLSPASKLFQLALNNFAPYATIHESLDLQRVRATAQHYLTALVDSRYAVNPWSAQTAPAISLE